MAFTRSHICGCCGLAVMVEVSDVGQAGFAASFIRGECSSSCTYPSRMIALSFSTSFS
jgi:hypothetical protein